MLRLMMVLLALVPFIVKGITVEELQVKRQNEMKELHDEMKRQEEQVATIRNQYELELAEMKGMISSLQAKWTC